MNYRILLALLAVPGPLPAQTNWQEALAKMPLIQPVRELNRSNAAPVMLASFRRNPAVKALIFMPGATDEFYFFRRARARLTNSPPTLLDAVEALTNQTYIRATLRPPFLLLHTAEDPLEPISVVEDRKTADSIQRHHYDKAAIYDDRDWDYMEHLLGFYLNTNMRPRPFSHDSNHFFRHSFAEFDLNGWEALEAVAMAGKTKFTVKKNMVVFDLDDRALGAPPLEGFSPDPF
ncbi:MAG: hypothetical protein ABSF38_07930 [Verrucomicrobiota bacterium]|jgi:hypothetical protein